MHIIGNGAPLPITRFRLVLVVAHWLGTLLSLMIVSSALTVPIITPTKTDTLVVDVDMANVVDPGDTVRYTSIVTQSGTTSAVNVSLADTVDPKSTSTMPPTFP